MSGTAASVSARRSIEGGNLCAAHLSSKRSTRASRVSRGPVFYFPPKTAMTLLIIFSSIEAGATAYALFRIHQHKKALVRAEEALRRLGREIENAAQAIAAKSTVTPSVDEDQG